MPVGTDLGLKGMPEFMGYNVTFGVFQAKRSHPEGTYLIVVGASVGRAVFGIVYHKHHAIDVCLGFPF